MTSYSIRGKALGRSLLKTHHMNSTPRSALKFYPISRRREHKSMNHLYFHTTVAVFITFIHTMVCVCACLGLIAEELISFCAPRLAPLEGQSDLFQNTHMPLLSIKKQAIVEMFQWWYGYSSWAKYDNRKNGAMQSWTL